MVGMRDWGTKHMDIKGKNAINARKKAGTKQTIEPPSAALSFIFLNQNDKL